MDLAVTEEFRQLLSRISDFVKNTLEPISLQVETEEKIPEEIVAAIRKLGLFGMPVPKEYGGLGLTAVEEMLVYEEITKTNTC